MLDIVHRAQALAAATEKPYPPTGAHREET